MNRIAGLETEYGCLTEDPAGLTNVVSRVRNWIFENHKYGLADIHQRDWDEPAGNGGFLFNGGRAYIDMGHLEYCTPECLNLLDIVRYDRAGDAILNQAIRSLKLSDRAAFIRNNVDHYSGATFGCHENYLVRRSAPLNEKNLLSLLTFLTLRILYTGAGRVGCTPGAEMRGDLLRDGADPFFQISQRADYINNDLFEWVQFNRAIINTRDEPLADGTKFRRLHLLHGDTNVLPITLALKIGTTALVLDLLEADCMPKLVLADAVMAFRTLSHQIEKPWVIQLANGKSASAIELIYKYWQAANREFKGRDAETDALLLLWKECLFGLDQNPESLIGKVDWVTKHWLLSQFVDRERLAWTAPWLKSLDLEFHHVDPKLSLAYPLAGSSPGLEMDESFVEEAMRKPPANTRAAIRSQVMKALKGKRQQYFVDWELIHVEGINSLNLLNPFESTASYAEAWIRTMNESLSGSKAAEPHTLDDTIQKLHQHDQVT